MAALTRPQSAAIKVHPVNASIIGGHTHVSLHYLSTSLYGGRITPEYLVQENEKQYWNWVKD